jgi:hypothetical protein
MLLAPTAAEEWKVPELETVPWPSASYVVSFMMYNEHIVKIGESCDINGRAKA